MIPNEGFAQPYIGSSMQRSAHLTNRSVESMMFTADQWPKILRKDDQIRERLQNMNIFARGNETNFCDMSKAYCQIYQNLASLLLCLTHGLGGLQPVTEAQISEPTEKIPNVFPTWNHHTLGCILASYRRYCTRGLHQKEPWSSKDSVIMFGRLYDAFPDGSVKSCDNGEGRCFGSNTHLTLGRSEVEGVACLQSALTVLLLLVSITAVAEMEAFLPIFLQLWNRVDRLINNGVDDPPSKSKL